MSPERSRGRRWAALVGSWTVTVMDRLCCPGLQGITTVLPIQVMDSYGHGPAYSWCPILGALFLGGARSAV